MAKRDYLVSLDLNKNELLNAKLQNLGAPPTLTSNDKGYIYWNTVDSLPYFWTGTVWVGLTPPGALLATDYDAYSVLVANTVDTPVNVALGTNTVLGRISGNIQAITIDSDLTSVSGSDDTLASAKAIKAYIDSSVAGGLVYQGGYNASTNTPDLDTSPSGTIKKGWTYTVTADGTFFSTAISTGDVIIAEKDAPTLETDWTIVNKNIPDAITLKYATNITGNGSATAFTVTHNLNTLDIVTFVKEATTSAKVEVEEIVTDVNTLTLNFNVAPVNGKVYRVTVVG